MALAAILFGDCYIVDCTCELDFFPSCMRQNAEAITHQHYPPFNFCMLKRVVFIFIFLFTCICWRYELIDCSFHLPVVRFFLLLTVYACVQLQNWCQRHLPFVVHFYKILGFLCLPFIILWRGVRDRSYFFSTDSLYFFFHFLVIDCSAICFARLLTFFCLFIVSAQFVQLIICEPRQLWPVHMLFGLLKHPYIQLYLLKYRWYSHFWTV